MQVPLGYSPEWGEGSSARYGPDPACDIAMIRWLALSLIEAAKVLGIEGEEADGWRDTLDLLADYPQGPDGLHVTEGQPLIHSHRHHSHLMAIHPLGVLTTDGSEDERALIERSMAHLVKTGMGQWAGHGMGPSSLIAARVGRGNMAWLHCELYARCCITPSTIHVNGDYRRFGLTQFTNRPMTIEGGFAYAAAIMEMLLQSWGGTIRLFPAVPDHWHDTGFEDLRAEGAFVVSARLREGEVAFARIRSEVGGVCGLRNPWPGEDVIVRGPDGDSQLSGETVQWDTREGADYLVFPAAREPDEAAMAPCITIRDEAHSNPYGVKRLPRF
jgi:alpha-L-fucosidase 2